LLTKKPNKQQKSKKAKTHLLENRLLCSKSSNCNTSAIIMLMKSFSYPIRIVIAMAALVAFAKSGRAFESWNTSSGGVGASNCDFHGNDDSIGSVQVVPIPGDQCATAWTSAAGCTHYAHTN
jgi:hypothetical protein